MRVCDKAERTASVLARILPNIGGPSARKRRLLEGVVNSTLLYAASIWEKGLKIRKNKDRIQGVQRKMALSVASAYRTVSTAAVLVITGMIPIHLLVRERSRLYSGEGEPEERERQERSSTYNIWQEEFDREMNGRWTRRLIRSLEEWCNRKHGEIN